MREMRLGAQHAAHVPPMSSMLAAGEDSLAHRQAAADRPLFRERDRGEAREK